MTKQTMTMEQAVEAFLEGLSCMSKEEEVPLLQAMERVLARGVRAPFSVPSFPKSAMDGYAVRSAEVAGASKDSPVVLRVIGERLAGETGEPLDASLNTAVRIMTGAEVPPAYDAVVREEDTDYGETRVEIYSGVNYHQNYCAVGEDVLEGGIVMPSGTKLGRIEIGTLASLGIARVFVRKRLRIRIISTGTELLDVDGASILPSGKIYNSIAYMLEASLMTAGFEADHVSCPDEEDSIASAIRSAVQGKEATNDHVDAIITTGGVSVGKKDLIPSVLSNLGADVIFQRVQIQPGTPTMGSRLNGTPILSLSGNPYAALVNFDCYFWPLAARLTGCDAFLPVVEDAVLVTPYEKVNALRRLLRARVENGKVTLPAKSHASSVLSNLMNCNCYVDLPAGHAVKPGDIVVIRRMC